MDSAEQYGSDGSFDNTTKVTEREVVAQYLKEIRQTPPKIQAGAIIKRAKKQPEKEQTKELSVDEYMHKCHERGVLENSSIFCGDYSSNSFSEKDFSAWEYSGEESRTIEKYLRLIDNVRNVVRERYSRENILENARNAFRSGCKADDDKTNVPDKSYNNLEKILESACNYVVLQNEQNLSETVHGIQGLCCKIDAQTGEYGIKNFTIVGNEVSAYLRRMLNMSKGIDFALDYLELSAAAFPSNTAEQDFWPEKIKYLTSNKIVRKYGKDYLMRMKEIIPFVFKWFSGKIEVKKREPKLHVGK